MSDEDQTAAVVADAETTGTETPAPTETDAAPASAPATPVAASAPPGLRVPFAARPEGVPDEYWDDKTKSLKVDSVIKRNADLRAQVAKMGEATKPPEGGYVVPESERLAAVGIVADDPAVQGFAKLAGDIGLSQGHFDAIMEFLGTAARAPADAAADAEAAFGARAGAVVEANARWLATLPGDTRGVLERAVVAVPGGHKALADLRGLMDGPGRLPAGDAETAAPLTEAALVAMKRQPDYWQNPELQQKVRDGYAALYPPA